MKKNTLALAAITSAVALIACSEIPKEAYFMRGQPESLLEAQQREAVFEIRSKESVTRAVQWARNAKPSLASLHCSVTNKHCNKLELLLNKQGIEIERKNSYAEDAILVYDHMAVRRCENRYIDNPINPYNLNHPSFGCSLASNSAQMVTDKKQFTDPSIMDSPDARKSVQATDLYNTPSKPETDFAPLTTSETLSTGSGTGR